MNDIQTNSQAPFDAIKREDEHGEYWTARDLMPILGYTRWERTNDVIDRATVAIKNTGITAEDHIRASSKMTTLGKGGIRYVEDYRLTRYGAYMVAMNGDPRKTEVAAAQTYFAVKTREAEVRPFNPGSLTRTDILKMALDAEEEKKVLESALESAAPAIAYHDRYVSDDDVLTVKAWGAQFGLTEPQAREKLLAKHIIYRQLIGRRWSGPKQAVVEEYEYRARAGRVTFPWFDLRPQHNAPRHHNGQVRQTLYIRQFFSLDLGAKVGLKPLVVQTEMFGGDAA